MKLMFDIISFGEWGKIAERRTSVIFFLYIYVVTPRLCIFDGEHCEHKNSDVCGRICYHQ